MEHSTHKLQHVAPGESSFIVIMGEPSLFFVGGVLPEPGQKIEMVCTGSSETEVQIQLQVVQE